MTTASGSRYFSEEFQQAEAKGLAKGLAKAVLTLLEGRNVEVPDSVRDRILSCTDQDQLRIWLLRASAATTIDDVLAE